MIFSPACSTRFGRSVTLTLNTLTRILGKRGLIVPMFVRPLSIHNHSEPFAQYARPSSHGSMYLKWLLIHRSVRLTLNMLIRIPDKYTPTVLRNAGQLKLRVSKRNTRSHNKVPHLFPLYYPPLSSWISQQQQRAVTLVAHSLLLCIQQVPTGITAVNPMNSMSTH